MLIEQAPGATLLSQDDIEGLIPKGIVETQPELNAWEGRNILEAHDWLKGARIKPLDFSFLINLHKKMFGKTWRWAGKFRRSWKNIGVDWPHVPEELKKLLDDTVYQIEAKTYSIDEIAARFHHRLVWIHCFANGNGRHARLAADLLLKSLGEVPFSWGRANLSVPSDVKKRYIESLRLADKGDYSKLLIFVRS